MKRDLYENMKKRTKKKSKKRTLSGKEKTSLEIQDLKVEENQKNIFSKKPPLSKKQSLPSTKISCTTPKRSSKISKKKIELKSIPPHFSDTEKSTKRIESNRAKSNLEHSLKNKLELSQKVLLSKNHNSPSKVEQIIKHSLKKAKKQKITKEKEAQHKHFLNEIQKLEQEHQNNLIRKLNLQKFKKKKFQPINAWTIGKTKPVVYQKISKISKKSKLRSISTKRVQKDKIKTIKTMRSNSVGKEYFTADFKPYEQEILQNYKDYEKGLIENFGTYREGSDYYQGDVSESEIEEIPKMVKISKPKVKRNISLIDTGELITFLDPVDSEIFQEKKTKANKYDFGKQQLVENISFDEEFSEDNIDEIQYFESFTEKNTQITQNYEKNLQNPHKKPQNNEKNSSKPESLKVKDTAKSFAIEVQNFTQNSAAKKIQREFRAYKQRKIKAQAVRNLDLEEIIKEQIG